MMDAKQVLDKVLGLPRIAPLGKTQFIAVSDILALQKQLTEAGERRVMVDSYGYLHFEDHFPTGGAFDSEGSCKFRGCRLADDTEKTRAWVARQRKDSDAG